jgi:hypothetical protein
MKSADAPAQPPAALIEQILQRVAAPAVATTIDIYRLLSRYQALRRRAARVKQDKPAVDSARAPFDERHTFLAKRHAQSRRDPVEN